MQGIKQHLVEIYGRWFCINTVIVFATLYAIATHSILSHLHGFYNLVNDFQKLQKQIFRLKGVE